MSGFAQTFTEHSSQHVSATVPSLSKPIIDHRAITILHGRKRPREVDGASTGGLEPFLILPYPHSHLDKSTEAWPQLLLPRALLPLSFLEPQTKYSHIFRARFFTSEITSLESENGQNSSGGPTVLVAKMVAVPGFCAIERVETGLYSLCWLASWVGLERLRVLADSAVESRMLKNSKIDTIGTEWWSDAASRICCRQQPASMEPKNTAVVSPIFQHNPDQVALKAAQSAPIATGLHNETTENCTNIIDPMESVPVPEEIYSNIISQYLDSLYLSKTSLAYFAKGPLSRARALCSTVQQIEIERQSLSEFLRCLVLGISTLDKKYKESIPATVKKIASMVPEAGNIDTGGTRKLPKRRKSKKVKAGKDGLYPGEDDIIVRWWIDNDHELATNESVEVILASRLVNLRFRETLLQLTIILEVLALDRAEVTSKSQDCDGHIKVSNEEMSHKSKNSRTKKPHDFDSMIETLIDRLSIWQSIEVMGDSAEKNADAQGSANDLDIGEGVAMATAMSDQLKDFYTEVMLPFYAARIPELVKKLAPRFGASAGRSSPKRQSKKLPNQHQSVAPGSELPPSGASRSRKGLSRVATDSLRPTEQPPSLMRSATDSLVQGIKREKSAIPRLSFDFKEQKRPLSRSGSISQAKMLNHREVDFGFISKFNESKARKKVNVEQELRDAISTLKKPNRGLAVKELVDAADSRKLTNGVYRSINVIQRRPGLGVQVNATPHRLKKTKDVLAFVTQPLREQASPGVDEMVPSSGRCVPWSAVRSSTQPGSWARLETFPVSETPSRGSQRFLHPITASSKKEDSQRASTPPALPSFPSFHARLDDSGFTIPAPRRRAQPSPTQSGLGEQAAPPFATPFKSRNLSQSNAINGECDIVETPVRRVGNSRLLPTLSMPSNYVEPSIYDGLGWNDGDDINDVM